MNPKDFAIVGGRYLIDAHTGYVVTIGDFEAMKNTNDPNKRKCGGLAIKVEDIKDFIKDGYVQNWNEIYEKWSKKELGKDVINEYQYDNGNIRILKETPKQEEQQKDYESGFYRYVPPKQKARQETRQESKQEEPDLDIPDWVSHRRKENDNMRYEGSHVAGNMDSETAKRARYNAQGKSHTDRKHVAERNRTQTDEMPKKKIVDMRTAIISIAVAAGILAATIAAQTGISNLTTKIHTDREQTYIATLLVPEGAKNIPTIVERNTHDTDDFQRFWYDNAGMAEEILEIPDVMFDATFYSVYNEMGEYRSTAYCDNFDAVIADIAESFNIEDAEELKAFIEAHPNAYARCAGCKTLDEYLTKNGFVDEQGLPSEEKFVEYSKKIVNSQYDYIKNTANDYGTDWVEEGQVAAAAAATEAQENEGSSRR